MIPRGLYGAAIPPAGPSGPSIVQLKSATTNTLTLDAAPTPGNLLVIAAGNGVTTPASWTYSHDLAIDVTYDASGWDSVLASGIVQGGDSATVTITGMNASYPRVFTAYEISGATGAVDTDGADGGGNFATSVSLSVTSGLVVIAVCVWSANITTDSAAATDMTKDFSDRRVAQFSSVGPAQPFSTDITWITGRTASAVMGGYS